MKIHKFNSIINKVNYQTAIVLDNYKHQIVGFDKDNVKYSVFPNEKKIVISDEENEIILTKVSDEVIYYSLKTEYLTILLGKVYPIKKINRFFIATLK